MLTLQFDFIANRHVLAASIADWQHSREIRASTEQPRHMELPTQHVGGSTGWVIAPQKSASGRAMLLINPHLPWHGRYLLYEAHLVSGGLDFYGATAIGFPILGMGFNDHLGWTHTVNTIDAADLYEITLADGGYRWDGVTRPLQVGHHVIRLKQADGSLSERTLDVSRSIQGPIIARSGDQALALRIDGLETPSVVDQYRQMMRATNEAEFLAALRRLQIPLFTVLYADQAGHIMTLFGGRTPRRPFGNWDYWHHVVPGDTSATLWKDSLRFDELPLVSDPPSGWLQNANEPPWTSTIPAPLDPAAFPDYIAPRDMTYRAQSSLRFLETHGRLSFEDVIAGKFSTQVEMAGHFVDALTAAARTSNDATALRAASVLEAWDRRVDKTSRGAVLFDAWVARMGGAPKPLVPWDPNSPLTTPRGLLAPDQAVRALVAAANDVKARYGALDVAWGEVHRFFYAGHDFPASGAGDPLGVLRSLNFGSGQNDEAPATGGDSFTAVVEFGDKPHAAAVLPYGNAGPGGTMLFDEQMSRYMAGNLRPVWKERRDVEQHTVMRESPPVELP
jgi:acyl-homoserine-lactone acylase